MHSFRNTSGRSVNSEIVLDCCLETGTGDEPTLNTMAQRELPTLLEDIDNVKLAMLLPSPRSLTLLEAIDFEPQMATM
eukprot:XP_001707308.1 Hypothetical protein GL50803_101152 [Giardia lamblia ATCC 50803]